MYSLLFIAVNNIKKKKSNSFILLFLVTLAVLLLYVSISILTNTGKVMDKTYDKSHCADYFCMIQEGTEEMTELIISQPEVEEYEIEKLLYVMNAWYHKESEENNNYQFILESMDTEKTICRLADIVDGNLADSQKQENSILLPYYLKADGSFKTGDSIFLTLGEIEYEFVVSGFVEDPLFATPLNVSMYKCYITEQCMQDILNREPMLEKYFNYAYKIRLKEGESSQAFEEKMSEMMSVVIPDFENQINLEFTYDIMREGNMMLSNIAMGIILVFSILLIFVGLIIIRFSMRNFVEENMKNIGILQASGYTGKQLRRSSVLEIMGITIMGIILGLFLGGICSVPIGNLESSMIGLRWNQTFDWQTAILSGLLVLILVMAAAVSVSRMYGRIMVLEALRGGIHTHNFRKNYLSLDTCRLPESALLGCKCIIGEKVKSISILCIVILLSFASCVGFAIYQSFSKDRTNLLKITGIELGTAIVTGENLEEVGEEVMSWEEIDFIQYKAGSTVKIINGENEITLNCDIWENPDLLEHESLVKGRLPRNDNEITLTVKASKKLGVSAGDVVYVESKGERKDYIVSGIDQKINNLGIKAMMNVKGAERLNIWNQGSMLLYIYTKAGVSYKDLVNLMKGFAGISILDSQKQAETALSSVQMGMKMICIVFVMITLIVVTMVVMLLIKSRVIKERKNYGIYKAIGFTTKQLIVQTMMSNLPIIILGAVIGSLISIYLTKPLAVLCLSAFGIQKVEMIIDPFYLILTILGIGITATLVSLICSIKIRKIEPVKMLVEE